MRSQKTASVNAKLLQIVTGSAGECNRAMLKVPWGGQSRFTEFEAKPSHGHTI